MISEISSNFSFFSSFFLSFLSSLVPIWKYSLWRRRASFSPRMVSFCLHLAASHQLPMTGRHKRMITSHFIGNIGGLPVEFPFPPKGHHLSWAYHSIWLWMVTPLFAPVTHSLFYPFSQFLKMIPLLSNSPKEWFSTLPSLQFYNQRMASKPGTWLIYLQPGGKHSSSHSHLPSWASHYFCTGIYYSITSRLWEHEGFLWYHHSCIYW